MLGEWGGFKYRSSIFEGWKIWSKVFKILMDNDFKCRILDLVNLLIKCKERIKSFLDIYGYKNIYFLCFFFM